VEHVSHMIEREGIDTYRQDFNFEPLTLWQFNDTPDRIGITEIEHVEGYLSYFDELHRRFPNLLIDTCASGGRRNDLETLRRAVPLWRSDFPYDPAAMQMQTYGLCLGSTSERDQLGGPVLSSAAQITPAVGIGLDPDKVEAAARAVHEDAGPMEECGRLLLRRLLPAHALQHRRDRLDGMAIRATRRDCGHGAGLSSQRQPV